MAQVNFVSKKNYIYAFYQAVGLSHDEIDEPVLISWASDCLRWFKTSKELTRKLAVLQIKDTRAKLPVDYEMLGGAFGRVRRNKQERTRREQIIQWSQTIGEDCQLEINMVCKKCNHTPCDCDTPVIEVKVDELWLQAHPEVFYSGFSKIGRFGYGPQGNQKSDTGFSPMRYAAADKLFNLNKVLAECPNIECTGAQHEFIIDTPYIEVDFEIGEVLLSYLGKKVDEDGDLLVPDHPDVHMAVLSHLKYMYYSREGGKKQNQFYINLASQEMQNREYHIGLAKSSMDMPNGLEIKSYLEDSSMLKRVPQWSSDYADGKVPDLYKGYLE